MDTSKYRARLKELEQDRSSWKGQWEDIADYMLPRKGQYLKNSGQNKSTAGNKKGQKIINNKPTKAVRTLAAGLQGGLTSPARPWFVMGLPDESLSEYGPVREWLHQVTKILLAVFAKSNFYGVVHEGYTELGAFGTNVMMIEEDFETVIRCTPFSIGEYYLSVNASGRVDTLYRKYDMSARQLIEEFGEENVSDSVRSADKNNGKETMFQIVHCVQPNPNYNAERLGTDSMAYESVYFELSCTPDKILRKSGYRTKPFTAPRWGVSGRNAYGDSPGMDSLGDVKQLQKMEEKKLQALDKMVDPPMNAPSSLKKQGGTVVPGGVNYIDSVSGGQGFTPAYQVNPDLQGLAHELSNVEERIYSGFFNDLFLALMNESKRMTATEVAQRHEEKLIMLGPVLDRMQTELLDVIIDRAFDICMDMGIIPPAPPEIDGMELDIEYISMLAQAQKLVGVTSIEQVVGFAGNLAAANPDILDKIDMDEAVDQYANLVGVPPKIVRSDDVVAQIREAKQKQIQQQQQMEQSMAMAQGAKTLSEVDTGENNMLTALMGGPQQ